MLFSKTILNNGLRVLTVPMPSMQSATVQIMIKAGSRNETAKTNGIAHFLEHMVFKGTKSFPSTQIISSSIDKIGGDINANTSKERTAYYIKAWDRYLSLSFDILSGFVKNALLEEKEIDKERGVIIEEIAMYNDLPMQKAPDLFEEMMYRDTDLGTDVLGTSETIKSMKRDDFLDFIGKYYTPQNMVLAIAGKFDTDEVVSLSQEYFGELGRRRGDIKKEKKKAPTTLPPKSFQNPTQKPEMVLLNRKTEQAHIVLGVRSNPIGHPDQYKESVLNAILGGGMSSRMWSEVREKRGLAYYVRTYFDRYIDTGYFAVRAGIKIDQVDEAIKVILDQLRSVASEGEERITEEELVNAKEHLKGSLALDLEDTHSVAEFIGNQELFRDRVRTIDEIMKGIDSVTVDDVREMSQRFFQNDRLNLAVLGPYKSKDKLQKLLTF
jgi:predicted Zn-dependent peptidase